MSDFAFERRGRRSAGVSLPREAARHPLREHEQQGDNKNCERRRGPSWARRSGLTQIRIA